MTITTSTRSRSFPQLKAVKGSVLLGGLLWTLLWGTVGAQTVVRVKYGYFPEARPLHAACARGWLDLHLPNVTYEVECYPQTSGNYAASRLDNLQLDVAHLGSTPLAQALARGMDIKVIYISQYQGDSQGIYVRPSEPALGYVGIEHPFHLKGRTVGVPFGSTVHYQLLFLIDLIGLSGSVNLINMSPTEIIEAWSDPKRDPPILDAAGCWGTARKFLLSDSHDHLPAETLMTAKVMSDWGRPTFVDVATTRVFADNHPEFLKHLVGVLSRINDSYLDRLGEGDELNVHRWDPLLAAGISLVPSMVDALMIAGEEDKNPSAGAILEQRRNLELFGQQTTLEQLSCDYLGPAPQTCEHPTLQHLATRETGEFLIRQKVLSSLGPLETLGGGDLGPCFDASTLCGSNFFDGSFLQHARARCDSCLPVGPYTLYNKSNPLFADSTWPNETDDLLLTLEEYDEATARSPYAPSEIGRAGWNETSFGNSDCSETPVIISDSLFLQTGLFGDGANAFDGLSYSDNMKCTWIVRGKDCEDTGGNCDSLVEIQFVAMRLWSGDFVRVYTSEDNGDCATNANVLLGQVSGVYENGQVDLPPIRAKGCVRVEFESDSNQERLYGGNQGDGFLVSYDRDAIGCTTSNDCNGHSCGSEGLCICGGDSWGANCSLESFCQGTNSIGLSHEAKQIRSSNVSMDLSPANLYPNDLDCRFKLIASSPGSILRFEIFYDLETSYDLLEMYSTTSNGDGIPYLTLTGRSTQESIYYVPTGEDGIATVRMTTDSRGRRSGFFALVTELQHFDRDDFCDEGYSGYQCEVPHCVADNQQNMPSRGTYSLGRIVSQTEGQSVPAMPWAPEGGCVWKLDTSILGNLPVRPQSVSLDQVRAIRLFFNKNISLDLEPHPATNVGDKLVVKVGNVSTEFFVERCLTNETCFSNWQTGNCVDGGCRVNPMLEISVSNDPNLKSTSISLVTDRNDGGRDYTGLDFDVLMVMECPSEEALTHCEAGGGECVDGFCFCPGDIPCDCPCEGEAPLVSSSDVNPALVVGVIVPIFALMAIAFWLYRRRQIRKYRAQKKIIAEKEVELQTLRDSIVGMRAAEKSYIPTITEASPLPESSPSRLPASSPKEDTLIFWCWKETDACINNHDPEDIYGDPKDCWVKYSETSNLTLEAAFQMGMKSVSPLFGYEVDLKNMKQKKNATGFERRVIRVVEHVVPPPVIAAPVDIDLTDIAIGTEQIPNDVKDEPQMIVVAGDIIKISKQRGELWAFGTKLHHADESVGLSLLHKAEGGDLEIATDTGWFPLDITRVPTGEDLAALQTSVGDSSALNPPSHWDTVTDPTVAERRNLNLDSPEAKAVVDAFLSTLKGPSSRNVHVKSVERIQNVSMWQSYVVKRQTICYRETGGRQETDDVEVGRIIQQAIQRFERCWLWHATNIQVIDKILQQGFNRSFCGKHATIYGKGVYFARDASYSACTVYAVPDRQGIQYMLACRVVVGEYCKGRSDALTPDVRDTQKNILYDSTVGLMNQDTMSNPSIYVTYHDAQAYPEYLISFKT